MLHHLADGGFRSGNRNARFGVNQWRMAVTRGNCGAKVDLIVRYFRERRDRRVTVAVKMPDDFALERNGQLRLRIVERFEYFARCRIFRTALQNKCRLAGRRKHFF